MPNLDLSDVDLLLEVWADDRAVCAGLRVVRRGLLEGDVLPDTQDLERAVDAALACGDLEPLEQVQAERMIAAARAVVIPLSLIDREEARIALAHRQSGV